MEQRIYQIGLTMINGVGDNLSRQLLQFYGNAENVFNESSSSLAKLPGIGGTISAEIKRPEVLQRAEKEFEFAEKNGIRILFIDDSDYPKRLKECADAPLILYFRGNANFEAAHVLSVVGTRNSTDYGRGLTDALISNLAEDVPDLLIISGLAYGIDICSHRAALANGLPTVGILAHGLDRIYPAAHTGTAKEMLSQGGLLTEMPSGTEPDRPFFVRRNRIIAGLADATVVVESADKGGSLITADIAFSYGRDVYSFPGRASDTYSCGCNKLIRQNKAGLICSASDLIKAMSWDLAPKPEPVPTQTKLLFPNDDIRGVIVELLRMNKEMQVNQLSIETDLPISQLSAILFDLEIEGIVTACPGSVYKLADVYK